MDTFGTSGKCPNRVATRRGVLISGNSHFECNNMLVVYANKPLLVENC